MKWIFHLYLAAVCFASGLAGSVGTAIVGYSALYYAFPVLKEEPYRIEQLMYPPCHKNQDVRRACREPLSEGAAIEKVHKEIQTRALRDGAKNMVWLIIALAIFVGHWRLFKKVYFNDEVKG